MEVEPVDFSLLRPGLGLTKRLIDFPKLVADPAFAVIHRDAENQTRQQRVEEIVRACAESGLLLAHVSLVPVRMTEAWLLCDESPIRHVVGKPKGRAPIDLPGRRAEEIADPKAVLREAILVASETAGRRRDQLARRFPSLRRQLLDTLDVDGNVRLLASFEEFRKDLHDCLELLSATETPTSRPDAGATPRRPARGDP